MPSRTKTDTFLAGQFELDRLHCPTSEQYTTSRDAYIAAWEAYVLKTRDCVEAFKKSLNHYPSYTAQDADKGPGKVRSHMTIESAITIVSQTRSQLLKSSHHRYYPHFHDEFSALKKAFPAFSEYLSELDSLSADDFTPAIDRLAKTDISRDVLDKLRALPFFHPAATFLLLPSEFYAERLRRYRLKKGLSHKRVPVVHLSAVKSFVEKVYSNLHHDSQDFANPYLASLFVTGRRSMEVGLVSKFSRSKLAGHITVIGLVKDGTKIRSLDIPVLFLTPDQALQLLDIARTRFAKTVDQKRPGRMAKARENRATNPLSRQLSKVPDALRSNFTFYQELQSDDQDEMTTTHNLTRGFYAEVAAKQVATQDAYLSLSDIEIKRQILGHDDKSVTLGYTAIKVVYDLPLELHKFLPALQQETVRAPGARDKSPAKTPPPSSKASPSKPREPSSAAAQKDKPTPQDDSPLQPAGAKPAPSNSSRKPPAKVPHKASKSSSPDLRKSLSNPVLSVALVDLAKRPQLSDVLKIHLAVAGGKALPTAEGLSGLGTPVAVRAYLKFLADNGIIIGQ